MKKKDKIKKYPIEKGYGLLQVKDADTVRSEIINALGLTSPNSWTNCLCGFVTPTVEKVDM